MEQAQVTEATLTAAVMEKVEQLQQAQAVQPEPGALPVLVIHGTPGPEALAALQEVARAAAAQVMGIPKPLSELEAPLVLTAAMERRAQRAVKTAMDRLGATIGARSRHAATKKS